MTPPSTCTNALHHATAGNLLVIGGDEHLILEHTDRGLFVLESAYTGDTFTLTDSAALALASTVRIVRPRTANLRATYRDGEWRVTGDGFHAVGTNLGELLEAYHPVIARDADTWDVDLNVAVTRD